MHEPIRNNLEEYLRGSAQGIPREFQAHLEACEECASQLRLLEKQSEMLRSLRCEGEAEPRPGFYARVMERVEAEQRSSIWSAFLDRRFGLRLALASAALALLLGTYLVTGGPGPEVAVTPAVVLTDTAPAGDGVQPDSLQQQQQRDAVLVDLASYHE